MGGSLLSFLYTLLGQLLGFIYGFIGNYAFSIVLFTLFVKLLLFPLNAAQIKSSREMQAVQPKLKAIQEKHKNDKEMLNTKTLELYKEHKVNPLAGCLPIFIQMPIIFALFGTLKEPAKYVMLHGAPLSNEALTQGFLWVKDLALPDTIGLIFPSAPSFMLGLPGFMPIVAAVLTYFQMTSMYKGQEVNEQMKMMNNIFPVMILFMSQNLSAGLMVYWVISTLFSIGQQMVFSAMPKGDTK
jgi:YidC/Oxa1 family membrane protein insertase